MKDKVFFVGAGGIGMAALERYCLSRKMKVGGYDLTPTELTRQLIEEGVEINYEGSVESIPDAFRNPADTLVVYTPAVNSNLPALKWFEENGFEIIKRSVFLGRVTENSRALCFAGTHGKTTTSAICAHILNMTPGVGCNAFLGGILKNYNSNLILSETSPFSVIEADEFDRSFHTLKPYVAIITSCDPDHLDIYKTEENYREAFSHFTSLIRENGFLLLHKGVKLTPRTKKSVASYTYSSNGEDADFMAQNIRFENRTFVFDLKLPDGTVVKDLQLEKPIEINIDNSVAAAGAVWLTGSFDQDSVRKALSTYQGTDRRFDLRWEEKKSPNRIIIDDYAHHPKEIETSIKTIRKMFPEREITVAFQPHLYTRTRDFASDFAKALSLAHKVIMVDLYPAREEPIPGISSETIFNLIENEKKILIDKEYFIDTVKNSNFDCLVTLGAGNLPNYIPELIKKLEAEQ